MNLQNKLEQFRDDSPYDVATQAKRLLATKDEELILYVLALGLTTAKQRQRHVEREYIKSMGQSPPGERLVPGRTTGSVKVVPIKHSKRIQNAMKQFIVDVWRIHGEQKLGDATGSDLSDAVKRETASAAGHGKNAQFYTALKERLMDNGSDTVRDKWNEKDVRDRIEHVYGEFRKTEAA